MTRNLPVVAIRGSVVFPHTDTLLSFGRPKSVAAVNAAFQGDKIVAVFSQKDPKTVDPSEEDLYQVGTIVTITQMMSTEGEVHALVRGQARIKLETRASRAASSILRVPRTFISKSTRGLLSEGAIPVEAAR